MTLKFMQDIQDNLEDLPQNEYIKKKKQNIFNFIRGRKKLSTRLLDLKETSTKIVLRITECKHKLFVYRKTPQGSFNFRFWE